jgi:hypothetical protein
MDYRNAGYHIGKKCGDYMVLQVNLHGFARVPGDINFNGSTSALKGG